MLLATLIEGAGVGTTVLDSSFASAGTLVEGAGVGTTVLDPSLATVEASVLYASSFVKLSTIVVVLLVPVLAPVVSDTKAEVSDSLVLQGTVTTDVCTTTSPGWHTVFVQGTVM